jgi:hypothetical protein
MRHYQRRRPDPGRAAQPDDAPATIWIIWPAQPTITDPKRINVTINAVMTILARASARHAAIRAKRL